MSVSLIKIPATDSCHVYKYYLHGNKRAYEVTHVGPSNPWCTSCQELFHELEDAGRVHVSGNIYRLTSSLPCKLKDLICVERYFFKFACDH